MYPVPLFLSLPTFYPISLSLAVRLVSPNERRSGASATASTRPNGWMDGVYASSIYPIIRPLSSSSLSRDDQSQTLPQQKKKKQKKKQKKN
jgi:hypothetical protein